MRVLTALALLASLTGCASAQSNCRLYLAAQYSWGDKVGFYLDLEGSTLEKLPVILGVADGSTWRFSSHVPGFVPDRDYQVRAVLGPKGSQVFLEGKLVAEVAGAWKIAKGPLEMNDRPSFAREPGDWLGCVNSVTATIQRDGAEVLRKEFSFGGAPDRALALSFFEPGRPQRSELQVSEGDTLIIDVSLRFAMKGILHWAPYLDRYGQCRYADFPEKVTSDEQLRADIAAEDAELAKTPPSPDFDQYGGYLKAGWKDKATGYFRVIEREGKWWLISPEGNPCFYTGVSAAPAQGWETTPVTDREFLYEWLPPHEAPWSAAWTKNNWGTQDGTEYACLYTCNLIRKYGAEGWSEKAAERAVRRLKAWGFGGGKWGNPPGVVSTPVLSRWGTPRLVKHPDVFDPAVCKALRQDLERQITPRLRDPLVLGWSLGNEYDEIINADEITAVVGKAATTPAKRALIDHVVAQTYGGDAAKAAAAWKVTATDREGLYAATPTLPGADLEQMRCLYEDRYYQTVYETVKGIDPNHLYLGFWIVPGWWQNEEDWRIAARHCDVIGYDRYNREYADERLTRLQKETGKPTLCGEFSMPPWYDGTRGFGRYGANSSSEQEAGELYLRWMQAASQDPYCVGMIWFMFRDQPLTGRGPGRGDQLVYGEHFAFGVITETDRVKWPLVRQMREANLQATNWRAKGEVK